MCVVTGSRADYGLLTGVLKGIQDSPNLELQLAVTGMHLSPDFGMTINEIEDDGFAVDVQIDSLTESDTSVGVTKSVGHGVLGFADAFAVLKPDLVVVLGDRFEILAAALAAYIAQIPIAHIHGGELTEGSLDDGFRHAITKLAHLHFVAADEYRRRVIQLGEHPSRVFNVGGLGADQIARMHLLSKSEWEASIDFKLGDTSLLVTQHAESGDTEASVHALGELLAALSEFNDTSIIFTMPNADAAGRQMTKITHEFVAAHPNSCAFESLGHLRYLSGVKSVNAVVGNSSSGLLEAPSIGTPTVNIGDRQRGRLRAPSVVNCPPERTAIAKSIRQVLSPDFIEGISASDSPYAAKGASQTIVALLENIDFGALGTKHFHDF